MPSRRPDGEPRLVDRVRWGNLARLAAVVAAGLLVALGPRACASSGAGGPALPPDQPAPVEPAAPAPKPGEPGARPTRARARERRLAKAAQRRAQRRAAARTRQRAAARARGRAAER